MGHLALSTYTQGFQGPMGYHTGLGFRVLGGSWDFVSRVGIFQNHTIMMSIIILVIKDKNGTTPSVGIFVEVFPYARTIQK